MTNEGFGGQSNTEAESTGVLVVTGSVFLRFIGRPSMVCHSGREEALSNKDAVMLAVLAVDGAAARARLASWLWPRTSPEQGRANLRQRVLRLRRLANQDVTQGKDIMTLAAGVRTDLTSIADALRSDPHALHGELLGGIECFYCDELDFWLQQARRQWHSRCHQMLARLSEEFSRAGDHAVALPYAQRLVREQPVNEQYHRQLMVLHHRLHDASAATWVFDQLCQRLAKEMDAIPGLLTRQLILAIQGRGDWPKEFLNETRSDAGHALGGA